MVAVIANRVVRGLSDLIRRGGRIHLIETEPNRKHKIREFSGAARGVQFASALLPRVPPCLPAVALRTLLFAAPRSAHVPCNRAMNDAVSTRVPLDLKIDAEVVSDALGINPSGHARQVKGGRPSRRSWSAAVSAAVLIVNVPRPSSGIRNRRDARSTTQPRRLCSICPLT